MIKKLKDVFYPIEQMGIKNKNYYIPLWDKIVDTNGNLYCKYMHVKHLVGKYFICDKKNIKTFDINKMEKKKLN